MYRVIEDKMKSWMLEKHPHPLLSRGARQVGKTFTIQKFGRENFQNMITVNFEKELEFKEYFEGNLYVKEILSKISSKKNTKVVLGKTLLFLDEIQECPRAITALRYFYEDMPGMHVIAAGSLLDLALSVHKISMPVGRIQYLFFQPLSFIEFLKVTGREMWVDYIKNLQINPSQENFLHDTLNEEFKKFMFIGGMPKVVDSYVHHQDYLLCLQEQSNVIDTYRDDFHKYAKQSSHQYLNKVFNGIPTLLSKKFKYSHIDPDIKSRELKNALELLVQARVAYKIPRTSGSGLPFGAEASFKQFKVLFMDIGLTQRILGTGVDILDAKDFHSIAAGALAEQVVGQELLAYKPVYEPRELYFWEREDNQGSAEVDYLTAFQGKVIPIEVKAGKTGRLTSMKIFIEKFKAPFGVRISQKDFSYEDKILSIPFYAIAELPRLMEEISNKKN